MFLKCRDNEKKIYRNKLVMHLQSLSSFYLHTIIVAKISIYKVDLHSTRKNYVFQSSLIEF